MEEAGSKGWGQWQSVMGRGSEMFEVKRMVTLCLLFSLAAGSTLAQAKKPEAAHLAAPITAGEADLMPLVDEEAAAETPTIPDSSGPNAGAKNDDGPEPN